MAELSGVTMASDFSAMFDISGVKKVNTPVKQQEVPKQPVKQVEVEQAPKDSAQIGAKEASSEKKVDFVDPKSSENFNVGLLPDPNTGEAGKFKVDSKGAPILDAEGNLTLDPNGKNLLIKVDEKGNAIPDKKGNIQFVSPNDINETSIGQDKQPKAEEELRVAPIINTETNQIKLVKVDEKGLPILDKKGELIDDPNGKAVYVKIDKDNNVIPDNNGNPIFVSPNDVPALAQQQKLDSIMKAHSVDRVLNGLGNKSAVKGAIAFVSTKLISGVSIKTFGAFGKETVGFGVKHAVAQAVGKELSKMTAKTGAEVASKEVLKRFSKESVTLAIKPLERGFYAELFAITSTSGEAFMSKAALKGLANESAVGSVKALAREGHVAADVANGVLRTVLKSEEKLAVEVTTKVTEKTLTKTAVKAVQKTMTKSSQKVLAEGTAKAVESGVAKAISRGGKEVASKILAVEGSGKVIAKTAEKAALEATAKGTTKAGTRLASLVPVAGAIAGAAITAWDTKDAIEKWKDPNATKTSKYLASATVFIDGASVACEASGVGAPIAWALTGASIVTSGLSDYFRYKK